MKMKNQSNQSNSDVDIKIPAQYTKKLLDAHEEHGQLFLLTLSGIHFIYRTLTVSELESIQKLANIIDVDSLDEWIVDRCLIYSQVNPNDCLYYILSILSAKILSSSSVSEEEYKKLIEDHRNKSDTLEENINILLLKVYPFVNPKKVNMRTKIKMQAVAEKILNTQILIGDESKTNRNPNKKKSDILSKERADKPDFKKDNEMLNKL